MNDIKAKQWVMLGCSLMLLHCNDDKAAGSGFCGDGTVDTGEECDGDCPESCDDGNACTADMLVGEADMCSASCIYTPISPCAGSDGLIGCGNGTLESGEQCDDGNSTGNDGCSASCRWTIQQIAAGFDHTCALLSDGNVRCWGRGQYGQLGYNNTTTIGDDETPASAGNVNVGGSVTQITAGSDHTCALLSDGNVRCWGRGQYGQLGYNNTTTIGDDETPASAGNVNVGGSVTQITAGSIHTCALLSDGNVRCWGFGREGQLGYSNTANIGDNETPASVGNVSVGGSVTKITAGGDRTCALLSNGSVRCWGYGAKGRLGYGNINNIGDDETPASAGNVNVGGSVTQIDVNYQQTCALITDGSVRCWGYGVYGHLGYGNTNDIGDNETPASAGNVSVGGSVTQIATAYTHTCALLSDGNVRCWGVNEGELGYGNTTTIGDDETPASAGNVSVGGSVTRVAAGGRHTCALLSDGNVRCWGFNGEGQLGYGNTTTIGDNETPASVGPVQINP